MKVDRKLAIIFTLDEDKEYQIKEITQEYIELDQGTRIPIKFLQNKIWNSQISYLPLYP